MPPSPPLITLAAHDPATLAWHEELLAVPSLLSALAEENAGSGGTLVILSRPGADLGELQRRFADEPALNDAIDATVIVEPATAPARRLLAARAADVLTLGEPGGVYAELPISPAVERSRAQVGRAS
jgi:hypothetical protein